tara:strand:+ start:5670 stop:5945 length:276 start_codon:yes stop_codon:yes gene_type:complete
MLFSAPPNDVEALVFGLQMTVVRLSPPDKTGAREAWFEYHCMECGGYQITIPDDPTDASPVTCTACGRLFGTFGAVKALGRNLARAASVRG